MTQFTPLSSAIGGALIGLSAVILLQLNGRIAGVSGITHGLFDADQSQRSWRILFLVGIVVGGLVFQLLTGSSIVGESTPSLWIMALAGLLVGIGTELGSGCTSGHGVCGIARLSIRSMIATAVFLGTGMLTASVVYLLFLS